MSKKLFECPRCFKRCDNGGALKTHMKTHKKPVAKSGSMLKWIVKRGSVKPESQNKSKAAVEMKPIMKTRQLKLLKKPVREPRPQRRPRRSQQPMDTSLFVAPPAISNPDFNTRSPESRIAHLQHYLKLEAEFLMVDKTINHSVIEKILELKHQIKICLSEERDRVQNEVRFQVDRARITV